VAADLSDALGQLEDCASASVVDFTLTDEPGQDDRASARLRLAVASGSADDALAAVRDLADEKDLHVVEPLVGDA
jgi:ACT domain-containing protein